MAINTIRGTCLGLTSATCGAVMVMNRAQKLQMENENGTKSGSKYSGAIKYTKQNVTSIKYLTSKTEAAIWIGSAMNIKGAANKAATANHRTMLFLVPKSF